MKRRTEMTFKPLLTGLAVLGAATLPALPSIDPANVTLSQNQRSRLVTVQYVLTGDPAVVTVDFQTNSAAGWVSIGGDKFANAIGDVYKLVKETGTPRKIFWQPTQKDAWPNRYVTGGNFRAVVKAWATNTPPPYMIVDLKDSPGAKRYYPSAEAIPGGITNDLYKTTRFAFRLVPAATVQWRMGGASGEVGQAYDNLNYSTWETQHTVTFTNDWYMGVYPVTQEQHGFFTAPGKLLYPSETTNNRPETATYPVESANWANLRGYHMAVDSTGSSGAGAHYKGDWPTDGHDVAWNCHVYGARQALKLPSADLPTEAMWEYACRAGTSTATYAGNLTVSSSAASASDPILDDIAWYSANSGGVTHPVGLKQPNAWGFYDMIGNVWEWCLDEFASVMASTAVIDPPGTRTDAVYPNRQLRGGSYDTIAYRCRSSYRGTARSGHDDSRTNSPRLRTIGYRLCCDAMALQ